MNFSVGIDVGAKCITMVLVDQSDEIIAWWTRESKGQPLNEIRNLVSQLLEAYPDDVIEAVGVTGSGYKLAKAMVGADHYQYAIELIEPVVIKRFPTVQTVMQIGLQDALVWEIGSGNKRRGKKNDCIRGLGAFWQELLTSWGMSAEQWDQLAGLQPEETVRISAKCPLYMSRDVADKLQWGYGQDVIIKGINDALARCYLQNIAKEASFDGDILLIGAMAQSQSFAATLSKMTGANVVVDDQGGVLYSYAIALAAREKNKNQNKPTNWRGKAILSNAYRHQADQCDGCENQCSLLKLMLNDDVLTVWGGRCDKWNEI